MAINMLVTTLHSYAPLQVNYALEDLHTWDKKLLHNARRLMGFSTTDSSHSMFLPPIMLGKGVKNIMDTDLKSCARELEIIFNGLDLESKTLRARWIAVKMALPNP